MKTKSFVIGLLLFFALTITGYGQWSATTTLPSNAIANCIAADGNNLYAGTLAHGIFRSSNNGTTWTPVNSGITQMQVWTLTISGNEVYAGTAAGGLFVSTNNGDSWTNVNTGIPNTAIVKAIYKFGGRLYAGTSNAGVHVSLNGGLQWTKTNTGIPNLICNTFAAIDTNIYAGVGMSKGVYRSGAALTWTAANTGLPNNSINALQYVSSNGLLYAGTYGGGIARSANGGTAWSLVNTGLDNITVFTLASAGTTLYAGNEYGVYRSTNNGDSWSSFNTGLTGASPVTQLAVQGSTLYSVYKGGIWKCPIEATGTDVQKSSTGNAKSFTLLQNYPNPFNPSTTIRFSLPETEQVTLTIYNNNGEEVAILVNSELSSGVYTVQWNAVNYPSGMYYYQLRTNSFTEVKTMLLLK